MFVINEEWRKDLESSEIIICLLGIMVSKAEIIKPEESISSEDWKIRLALLCYIKIVKRDSVSEICFYGCFPKYLSL